MGTRMVQSYANLFMANLEKDILASTNNIPKFWWRYIYIYIYIYIYFFIFIFLFYIYIFFNKKFMPINAKGTTVAQANSECTLITTDYNKEVLKCDLNVESVGWFVILLDNEFHEDTVLGT